MNKTIKEKWKGRAFVMHGVAGAAVLAISSIALYVCLLIPRATDAAVKLGVDGSWWLYAAAFSCATALGYGAKRVYQDHIFARLEAIKAAGPDDPE